MSPVAEPLRPGPDGRRPPCEDGPAPVRWPETQERPTLLLVHGAGCGAWVWAEGFADALAAAGCRVLAPDLPNGPQATLAERLAVLRAAMASAAGPVVLVGHSLGALLVQRLAGEGRAVAQVLLAPVPPEGLWAANLALLWRDPALWRAVARLQEGPGAADPALAARLFGPAMPEAAARRVLARLGGESGAAILEAQAPQPVLPGWAVGCPATVIAGAEDRLIPPDAAWRCALWHGTAPQILPAAGHLLMLEPGWERVVARILRLLQEMDAADAGRRAVRGSAFRPRAAAQRGEDRRRRPTSPG